MVRLAPKICIDCGHSWSEHAEHCTAWIGGRADQPCPCTEPGPAFREAVDDVNHPPHYTSHPSGVECITVTEHMGFNLGNAVKYIWRCDLKGDEIEDLRKAAWYIDREIARRTKAAS